MTTTGTRPTLGHERWQRSHHHVQLASLTGRAIRSLVADYRLVVFGLAQPIIMLVLFTQVFGVLANRAALPGQVTYLEYLVPALLVTTGIGPAAASGSTLVRDMDNGLVSRLRAMPITLIWVPAARSLADLTRTTTQGLALLLTAVWAFGFRPAGGLVGVLAAVALSALTTWALIWAFLALASWFRSLEVMQSISFFVIFPLMFASNAFVPTNLMPEWLRVIAAVNPLSYSIDAARSLCLGLPVGSAGLRAIILCSALLILSVALTGRWFRRPPGS